MNCTYCKREMHNRQLSFDGLRKTRDHYIPLSRGGRNVKENIKAACYCCNHLKGAMMPEAWESFMQANPLWWAAQTNIKCQTPTPLARLAPVSHLRSMTAEENARRIAAYNVRQLRELRKDEPIPLAYDDPAAQAAYEGAYAKRKWLLRVPA